MDLENELFGGSAVGNGEDGGREYILHMIKSLSKLARRSRENELAILLDAIVAATRSEERTRRR